MNFILWAVAGGALGWAGFAVLGYNEERGMVVSVIIGAVGGLIGGNVLAPMFSTPAVPDAFNFMALFVAGISAAACVTAGNLIQKRFGV